MKKSVLFCLLVISTYSFSQATVISYVNDSVYFNSSSYNKDANYIKKRKYHSNLKSKYSGNEFTYKEEKKKKKEIKSSTPPDFSFLKGFFSFMKFIFPFILGGIVVYIILKLYLGADSDFWNFKKVTKKAPEKLIYEDEDINDTDIEGLLKKAIETKNTRLAIRYYYLLVLKKLSEKEIIKYDKNKTNADYLFEIEDANKRNQFSYLSYIYTYVWYGEFNLNEHDFIKVEEKYNSFFKTIN